MITEGRKRRVTVSTKPYKAWEGRTEENEAAVGRGYSKGDKGGVSEGKRRKENAGRTSSPLPPWVPKGTHSVDEGTGL